MTIRPISLATSADADSAAASEPVGPARPLLPARQRTRPSRPPPAKPIPVEPLPGEDDVPHYLVGYRKPPKHSQFKPGHSGNPRGRPREAKGLKTIVRDTLTAKVSVRTATGDKRMSRMEAVMYKTVELGMKGNPRALAQLISLYSAAVPEAAIPNVDQPVEELSATDIAILEELKASWAVQAGTDQ